MKTKVRLIAVTAILFAIIYTGCSNSSGDNKVTELESLESESGEHKADVGEKGEGEEDGTQFGQSDVYDGIRNGAHMVLAYDAESNSFKGTVINTTNEVLNRVRIEVHLSNGIELGPTTAVDLKPGEKINVNLKATEKAFETWSTHAESGGSESGSEGEHGGEKEGIGEHK